MTINLPANDYPLGQGPQAGTHGVYIHLYSSYPSYGVWGVSGTHVTPGRSNPEKTILLSIGLVQLLS